jgi:hypothetical protein
MFDFAHCTSSTPSRSIASIQASQQLMNSSLYPAQIRLHGSSPSQTSAYEKGPERFLHDSAGFCQLLLRIWRWPRPTSCISWRCVCESASEARFSGETCRAPSEHRGRCPGSRASPGSTLEHNRLTCTTPKQPHGAFGRLGCLDRKTAPYREFSRNRADPPAGSRPSFRRRSAPAR